MSAVTANPTRRNGRLPRLPLEDWTFMTICGWVGLLVTLVLVGVVIDHWSSILGIFGQDINDIDVSQSIWAQVTGLVAWFVGFVSGYFVHQYLPAFLAQGRTRRDTAIDTLVFGLWMALGTAVLATLGFVFERVVYAIAGWQRGTPQDMPYDSFNDYGWMLATMAAGFTLWAAGGAMIGSGFYRSNERGLTMLLIALVCIALTYGGGGAGPFRSLMHAFDLNLSRVLGMLVSLAAAGVMAAVTWWNVRDVPLRNK